MEVLALERTLTELDHVCLLNLVRRDSFSDASPAPRLAAFAGALTAAPWPETASPDLFWRVA